MMMQWGQPLPLVCSSGRVFPPELQSVAQFLANCISAEWECRCQMQAAGTGGALLLAWPSQQHFCTDFSDSGFLLLLFFSLKFPSVDSWDQVEFVWHQLLQIGSYFNRCLGQNKG